MAYGFSESADVLPIRTTVDGVDLSARGDLFAELEQAREQMNTALETLDGFLSFKTAMPVEGVAQAIDEGEMEEASEYGIPRSMRTETELHFFGYNFAWFDSRVGMTFEFLSEATAEQVRSQFNSVIAADTRLRHRAVMGAVFGNQPRVTKEGTTIYPLWNGDTMLPPPTLDEEFGQPHNHYLTSGADAVDGGDLRDLIKTVQHHGYGADLNAGRLLVFVNPLEGELIRGFRVASGDPYDFIASQAAPPYLTQETIIGDVPPASYGRLPISGAYGPAWISENSLIPPKYLLCVASGGANSPSNPVGFREHARPDLRGLLRFGGAEKYPLQESNYVRGFGTGVRHRGAAAVMQITTNPVYAVPPRYELVPA